VHILQGERPMAADNKTLRKFNLDGIPPAPRSVPQIEVTFDIDANGIVQVSAKDKATGKEQKIRIESSSGLSQDDIEKLVREAEAHRAEDEIKRERVETRNRAESMVLSAEKTLKEHGDKLDGAQKSEIESHLSALKSAVENDASTTEELNSKMEALEKYLHAAAEKMYQNAAPQSEEAQTSTGSDDDVIDAEFEEAN
jgi:molecular chaperone DnaK